MNIYSIKELTQALEEDEINAPDEAFMIGYCEDN